MPDNSNYTKEELLGFLKAMMVKDRSKGEDASLVEEREDATIKMWKGQGEVRVKAELDRRIKKYCESKKFDRFEGESYEDEINKFNMLSQLKAMMERSREDDVNAFEANSSEEASCQKFSGMGEAKVRAELEDAIHQYCHTHGFVCREGESYKDMISRFSRFDRAKGLLGNDYGGYKRHGFTEDTHLTNLLDESSQLLTGKPWGRESFVTVAMETSDMYIEVAKAFYQGFLLSDVKSRSFLAAARSNSHWFNLHFLKNDQGKVEVFAVDSYDDYVSPSSVQEFVEKLDPNLPKPIFVATPQQINFNCGLHTVYSALFFQLACEDDLEEFHRSYTLPEKFKCKDGPELTLAHFLQGSLDYLCAKGKHAIRFDKEPERGIYYGSSEFLERERGRLSYAPSEKELIPGEGKNDSVRKKESEFFNYLSTYFDMLKMQVGNEIRKIRERAGLKPDQDDENTVDEVAACLQRAAGSIPAFFVNHGGLDQKVEDAFARKLLGAQGLESLLAKSSVLNVGSVLGEIAKLLQRDLMQEDNLTIAGFVKALDHFVNGHFRGICEKVDIDFKGQDVSVASFQASDSVTGASASPSVDLAANSKAVLESALKASLDTFNAEQRNRESSGEGGLKSKEGKVPGAKPSTVREKVTRVLFSRGRNKGPEDEGR